MDCKLMLQETFTHAKQNPPGDFPSQGSVFVTVSIHRSTDLYGENRDVVYFATGPLILQNVPFKGAVLSGDILAWVNTDVFVELKPKPGALGVQIPMFDLFPNNPDLKLRVSINESGFVSAQLLIAGKAAIGALGQQNTFQATCNNGLLTAVVGNNSFTLSFTLRKPN